MKTIVFSIGLNVGESEPVDQLQKTLYALANIGGTVRAVAMGRASWQGIPERFVQALVTAPAEGARYLAHHLQQSAVAVWHEGCTHWSLIDAHGASTAGASIAEFPSLFAPAAPRAVNQPGGLDTVGHSSVQPWSAGEVFPAVIARIENAGEYAGHELTIGAFREVYASYDDAHEVARWTCQHGRINPERYAQLVPGAGRSMAAYGAARS